MFGEHKYSVTLWYYLTKCFNLSNREGAAQKCLLKSMTEMITVLGAHDGENQLEEDGKSRISEQLKAILDPKEDLYLSIEKVHAPLISAIKSSPKSIMA